MVPCGEQQCWNFQLELTAGDPEPHELVAFQMNMDLAGRDLDLLGILMIHGRQHVVKMSR